MLQNMLWDGLVNSLTAVWQFLTQPIQPPLIILLILSFPLVLNAVRFVQPRFRKEGQTNQTLVPAVGVTPVSQEKVVIGGLVEFGPATYQVNRINYIGSGPGANAKGPYCTKCLSSLVPDMYSSNDRIMKCEKDGCVDRVSLTDSPKALEKRAENLFDGAWRKVLAEGKQPALDINKRFNS